MALLRAAPSSVWNYHVAGAAPLLVAIVYCVARSGVQRMPAEEIATAAGVLTLLFLWMSWAKIRFAQSLRGQLAANDRDPPRDVWAQVTLQGTQLSLIPLSLLAVFPLAWAMAFYGNINALANRPHPVRDAARRASQWQRQNWFALGLAAVFAIVVLLNVVILMGMLPTLARMFSGFENEFTRNPRAMLNWTFTAAALGLTWFVIDPLIQAMYVVRCFKGESIGSGADLQAALRRLVVGLAFAVVTVSSVQARPVSAAELDAKIRHALQNPAYSWQTPEPAQGDAPAWSDDVFRVLHRIGHGIRVALDWLGTKIRDLLRTDHEAVQAGKSPPKTSLRWAIYSVLIVIALLGFLVVRKALAAKKAVATPAVAPTGPVDLMGDVIASELPEDEWLRLAREALETGELRLALRAAYLANLAWLGRAGLVGISRFKSNCDYENEVRLRTRSDEITTLLKNNRVNFEGAWYGNEEKTPADVEDLQRNLARMRDLTHA